MICLTIRSLGNFSEYGIKGNSALRLNFHNFAFGKTTFIPVIKLNSGCCLAGR